MPQSFDSYDELDNAEFRRIQQPGALLRELYHDELNPPAVVTRVRNLRVMLWITVAGLVLTMAIMALKFNHFIKLREDSISKKYNMDAAYQRRANLFGNLVKLTLSHAELEHDVFSTTSKMRAEIIKNSKIPDDAKTDLLKQFAGADGAGAAAAQGLPSIDKGFAESMEKALAGSGGMESSIGRLLAVVEQYPNIKSSETYKHMMDSLVEMEDRIALRTVQYHEALRMYNQEISRFPWKMLADVTGFSRMDYVHMSFGGSDNPVLEPELYRQLIPGTPGITK
ncbi:MAG: hypothetical protein FD165_1776 [Gammaproteobacteria bacterium]|nr:MAG: hypothetical protein FD165_1776 [Gammaproteobacteria bacterium]TND04349.1 MAG: hypothetical protein FD120_1463 [Gammaproteobacteria bacterium]